MAGPSQTEPPGTCIQGGFLLPTVAMIESDNLGAAAITACSPTTVKLSTSDSFTVVWEHV